MNNDFCLSYIILVICIIRWWNPFKEKNITGLKNSEKISKFISKRKGAVRPSGNAADFKLLALYL
jgi:hypothetical protein